MHRSGTSALAGALEAMGFEIGPAGDVMPADSDNPDGYFELWSIVRANDDLLAHFGGRWDSPPVFEPDWLDGETAATFVDAERLALRDLYTSNRYVLKDPRISILLPLWRSITNDEGCAIVVVRDPLEVAASLSRRNGLPTLTGLALWAAYNRDTLRDLKGAQVHVCSYADLLENPTDVLTDITKSLQAWGELSDDEDLAVAAAAIRPELRRNSATASLADADPPPVEISELMASILNLRGRHDEFDMATIPKAAWWEGPVLEERRLLLQWALGTISNLDEHIANLLTENKILWQRSEDAAREAEGLRNDVERMRAMVPRPLRRLAKIFSPRA
jgi:hypothetical protein